jgi:hypothetical protein
MSLASDRVNVADVLRCIEFAPPVLVKQNPASKAKNPVMIPARDKAGDLAACKKLTDILRPHLSKAKWNAYGQPGYDSISFSLLLDLLPAAVAQLDIPGAVERLEAVDWEMVLFKSHFHYTMDRALEMARSNRDTAATLIKEAEEVEAVFQPLAARLKKRPRPETEEQSDEPAAKVIRVD